jgi:hypothetical protein
MRRNYDRYPRTLQEAFGPYTTPLEPSRRRQRTRPLRAVFVGLALGLAYAAWRLN